MLKSNLLEFGLNSTEADVYILIAKKPNIKAGEIISLLNINRPMVYRALESLIKLNLISEYKNKGGKSFILNEPVYFKTKANNLSFLESQISTQIQLMSSRNDQSSKVTLYTGEKAILDFFNLVVDIGQTWYIIGAVWGMRQEEFEKLIPYFKNKLRNSNTKTKVLSKFGLENLSWTPEELTESRVLPEDFANSPVVIHIFGEYVCHTIWEKPETVIVIKNNNLAIEYKKYFKLIWDKIK